MAWNWSNTLANISPDTFVFSETSDTNNRLGQHGGGYVASPGEFIQSNAPYTNHSNLSANFWFMDGHSENIKPQTDPRLRETGTGAWTAIPGD